MNKLKSTTWKWIRWIAIAALVAGIAYWWKFSPVRVESHPVQRGSITGEVMGTGTLEARIHATVSPKISGRIVEVLVDQGSRVTRGDVLVRLDDAELKQQVAIADANVNSAQAAIVRISADKDRAVAVYQQARRNNTRVQSLLEKNAASRDDADKATEMLAVAQSGTTSAEAAIAEAQTELIAAQVTAQYQTARFQDTKILAPFDGLVVKRSHEEGDVVVPGSSILTLISTDELWIRAWVDETEMSKLEPEQTARIVFRSEPQRSYPGKVARLGREADRETREFVVDVHALELPKNWAVGQRAESFIQVERREDALLVPADLLLQRDGETGVFVNVGGRAQWRAVQIGIRSRDAVEVTGGLEQTDTLAVPVNSRVILSNGRRISAE
ncbi:efflux RND transporter periplasmic adaptor subunit [Neorhodopirellula lusitana]|uniref:efflux RND transporter periplasmic adaptor subunit n=1 Tax=Neorhodopirellula lusitana TaxID=445327 RepID=UPI00384EE51E